MNRKGNGSGAHACNAMMRDALLHALQQQVAFDGCIKSKRQAIADQLVTNALAGDMRAIKEVFDRMDGKARLAALAREQPMEAGIELKEQLRRLTAWDFPPPAAAGSDEQSTPSADMPPPCGDRQRHCHRASNRRAACFACFVTDRRGGTSACLVLRPGAGRPVGSGRFGGTNPTGKPASHTGCSPSNCRAVRGRGELPR